MRDHRTEERAEALLEVLETQIAVDTLLRRAPGLSPTDEPVWRSTVAIHWLDNLSVRLRG